MTGFKSDQMRYQCKTQGCYYDQLPDWTDINNSFPGKIRPTDIDGMVEINGNVLFLEQKSVGAPITPGQARAFRELSKKDRTTVVAMRPGTRFELEALFYVDGAGTGWQQVYRSDLLRWFELWSDNALRKKEGD
jgi:hypothetical protein